MQLPTRSGFDSLFILVDYNRSRSKSTKGVMKGKEVKRRVRRIPSGEVEDDRFT